MIVPQYCIFNRAMQTNLEEHELLESLGGFYDWLQNADQDELERCFSTIASRVRHQLDFREEEEFFALGVDIQPNGDRGGEAGVGAFPSSLIDRGIWLTTVDDGPHEDKLPITFSVAYPHDENADVRSIKGAFMSALAIEIGDLRGKVDDEE